MSNPASPKHPLALLQKYGITALIVWFTLLSFACAGTTHTALMVPMSDGVRLATSIYLPSSDRRWPAILIRTPYNKSHPLAPMIGSMANLRGYALVAQDTRGRFASEGSDFPVFLADGWAVQRDGFDTVEWIARQPWSDGRVATVGASAMGVTQNMMAVTAPPHLVCQHSVVAFSSMYHQAAWQGGAWRKELVENWVRSNQFDARTTPTFYSHPDYDDFWRQFDPERLADRVNAPVMFVGGWYDIFNQGTIDMFLAVQERGGPHARGRCRLVMEAFGHGRSNDLKFRNLEQPKNADQLAWTDLWMKHGGKGLEDIPPVQYYVLGDPDDPEAPGNEWRSAETWPIPAQITPVYLYADGRLDWTTPTVLSAKRSFRYDPLNPVPTVGGANLSGTKGPKDQRKIENRPDVLLFESPVLTKPLEVTGRVKVRLWVSSDAPDTDFTAKLTDVYPDGRSMLVLDGIRRMRHRNSYERSEWMEPGKIYEVEIDLWSVSIVFNKGHRLRLAISSSNAPRFEPNPNTGAEHAPGKTRVATNTVYFDAEHPSHILLPLPVR
ncbi:MAG: CocE/NonD family hydrolase [Candidatus Sumerlaeia bacterium]|nr:CocE/NonD family hydrolase [Candidatus Sumerlaeia bacterium]